MTQSDTNQTLELFPQMLEKTKLLILDYDVTRYHSFDFFRKLLLDRDMFIHLKPEFLPFVRMSDSLDQLWWFIRNNRMINVYDNFTNTDHTIGLLDYENILAEASQGEQMYTTLTDVAKQFYVVFDKKSVTAYWLRYKHDTFHIAGEEKLHVYRTEHVMDLRMATALIIKENINCVMVAYSELMILLIQNLLRHSYTKPISFIMANYAYNYDPKTGIMRNIPLMNKLEYNYKHEFGLFDPFSGLHEERRSKPNG